MQGIKKALTTEETPGKILEKVVLTLRMISHALIAYILYPEGIKFDYQCPICNKINDDLIINQSNNLEDDNQVGFIKRFLHTTEISNSQFTVSADDFLPALTWVLIRANPTNIECILWLIQEFRNPTLNHGESAYCLSQLQSAVVWLKKSCHKSFDLEKEFYEKALQQYEASLNLILACKHGNIESIISTLNQGADVNALTPDGKDCPITACIRYKQKEALHQLIKTSNINVNLCLYRKQRPLMIAVLYGEVEIILALLRKGADRHAIDEFGNSAVSMSSNEDIATILRTESKDINILECIRKDSEGLVGGVLITLFLQDVSGVNKLYENSTTSPLHEAIKYSRVYQTKVLLTIGKANVNITNSLSESPLHTVLKMIDNNESFPCIVHERIPDIIFIVSMLLRAGAHDDKSTAIINNWKATAIADFTMKQKIKQQIIQLFESVDVSCVVLVQDNNYNAIMTLVLLGRKEVLNKSCPITNTTPLIASILYESQVIFNLLIEANSIDLIINLDEDDTVINAVPTRNVLIDVNERGPRGLTSCMYATQKGNVEMIASLLRIGANRSLLSDDNKTAFDIANLNNFVDAMNLLKYNKNRDSICILAARDDWIGVRSLIQQGVSVNSRQRHVRENHTRINELYSPLISAVAYNKKEMVKSLLTVDGIDVNIQNTLGQTPLMYASIQGDETLTLRLLRAGANRDLIDCNGKNALYWAINKNHESIVSLINNDPKKISIFDTIAKHDLHSTIALLKQGVDPNIKRNHLKIDDTIALPTLEGIHLETPLICASRYGRADIVSLLCKAPDIKINDSDCRGWTALFHASNNEDIIIMLLKRGATSTFYDIKGESPKSYKLL